MEKIPQKKWYKKKRYLVPLVVGTLFIVSHGTQTEQKVLVVQPVSAVEVTLPEANIPSHVKETKTSIPQVSDTQSLSNDNYYTNSVGNTVHSPAYTSNSSIPAGASAQCGDGTYSFSQSRRGTCSHHGGVSRLL
jgi:hypothetical protein